MPSRTWRTIAAAILVSCALAPVPDRPAVAQQDFYFVTNLDPDGDNWLALRTRPSTRAGRRIGRLGPDTVRDYLGQRSGP